MSRNTVIFLFQYLVFAFNPKKSALTPTQKIGFPGALVDSTSVILSSPKDKLLKVREQFQMIIQKIQLSILQLTKLVGFFVFHNSGSIARANKFLISAISTDRSIGDKGHTTIRYKSNFDQLFQARPSVLDRKIENLQQLIPNSPRRTCFSSNGCTKTSVGCRQ